MNVKIDDIMIDKPIVTTPHTSVAHAKQLMRDHHISSLPVVGPDGDAVGVVGVPSAYDLLAFIEDHRFVGKNAFTPSTGRTPRRV